ncbi:SpaA isopeptide-forming pilin-related protein [Listeria rustica]|uniref:Collagen binding domain-containing protein n=1 Tax=Listeria rustica TaxID=2713503 RepID=A0A7W1T4S2_9LIST|nr:SpaA isopeptide-forming pilin-related protein [Listeria rustica]MBA3925492.1 collagen binding domain-containing protein [Listeria rustica]
MKRWGILLFVVALILQIFVPQLGLADEKEKAGSEFSMGSVTLADTKEDGQSVFSVEAKVENSGAEGATQEITVSDNLTLSSSQNTEIVNGNKESVGTYSVKENKLELKLTPDANGTVKFEVAGKYTGESTADGKALITFSDGKTNGSQTIDVPKLETKEQEPATDGDITKDEEKPATDKDVVKEKEEPATKDDAVQKKAGSTTNDKVTKSSVGIQAAEPQNVKDIFASLGYSEEDSTILTGMEITYTDADGNPVTEPTVNDTIHFAFTWAIPNDVGALINDGDYYIVQLPDNVMITQNQTISLNEYGEVQITTDGQVKFVFTDAVHESSDVNGTIEFEAAFNPDNIDGPGDIVIDIPQEDKLPPETVVIKPDTDLTVEKSGHFDKELNPDYITWQVDINKSLDTIDNAVVVENFPAGTTYESVEVYKVDVDLSGNVVEGSEVLQTGGYTVDANGTVTFTEPISDAYRLVYTTKIDDSAKPPEGGAVPFVNTATLQGDGVDIPATATVTANYGKLLNKTVGHYDSANQVVDWTVQYNYGELDIPESDAVIHDTFGSDQMVLVPGSVQINEVTFDADGNQIQGDPYVEGTDYTIVPTADGFDIVFLHDVDTALNITYETTFEGTVDSNTSISNTVTTDTGGESTGTGSVTQQNIVKTLSNVNYDTKRATWNIDVNKNHYEMINWSLTDQLSPGLTMDTSTFQMKNVTTGATLVEGTDYDLEYNTTSNQFTVTFIGALAAGTTDEFMITYTTDYDTNVEGIDDPDRIFTNTATATWEDGSGGPHTSTDDATLNPKDAAKVNGFKRGSYNATTSLITWGIGLNYNTNDLGSAKITDPITDNQVYVPGSLHIYNYTVNPDGSIELGAEVSDYDQFTIEEPSVSNNQTLTVEYDDSVSGAYIVEFQTSLEGQVVHATYTNDAVFSNDTYPDSTLSAEVSIANGDSLVNKTGFQDQDGFVNWSLTVNPSLSTLDDVVVTDTPSNNQAIDEDSIVLYRTTVQPDGTITKDPNLPLVEGVDYTETLTTDNLTGQQVLTIAFLHEIDTAYILEYRAMIFISDSGATVASNEVTINGNNEVTIEDGDGTDVPITITDGSGTASGVKGTITFQKVDTDGNPLTGAVFEMLDKTKGVVLRESEVDANGGLMFGNVPYGDYFIREVKAPAGYTVSDALAEGVPVAVSAESSNQANVIPLVNAQNKVTLTKQNEASQPIAGAEFKLEVEGDSGWTEINPDTNYVTDADGQLVIEGLLPGSYRLIEEQAPPGYILNTTPIPFTVVEESDGQIPDVAVGPFINYQGDIEFVKTNEDGNTLSGAIFAVKDANGTVVKRAVAGPRGNVKVTGLAPGSYTIEETRAPRGMILNTAPIPFVIAAEAEGDPGIVSLGDVVNYKGSAILKKEDSSGNPLSGAVFTLKNSAGETIQTDLVSNDDGEVIVEDLAPGSYTLEETKAPKGMILNTASIPFVIAAEAQGKPDAVSLGNMINYKGRVILKKEDSSGNGLSGAKFVLKNSAGDTLQTNLVSNGAGDIRVNDLAPGDYQFEEVAAPTGYKLDKKAIPFTIVTTANGEPEVLALEFVNQKLDKPDGDGITVTPSKPGTPDSSNPSAVTQQGNMVLPATGDSNGELWLVGFGVLFLIGGTALWLYRRKVS